jgi:hypothetical protein
MTRENDVAVAGQRITFGLALDGQRTTQPGNTIGESVVGPLGFLNILETQLGLLALHPSQVERVVQYRDCIARADSEQRFYHRSFATDPLGTAACLLDWRDKWFLHGWNGRIGGDAPGRLRDMADVDALAIDSVALGIGQRLALVSERLRVRKADIAEVRLVDAIDAFPARWRAVLAQLPIVPFKLPNGGGRGFLGALQGVLNAAAAGSPIEKIDWQDDGSVIVAQAETCTLAAHWLAPLLDDAYATLLISGANGARLDATLAAAGRPRQGLKESSAFRPALQILPLALELVWDPLNYYALVQFLTHPVCPVPGYARRKLAEKVADAPGIGGEYWKRILAGIDKHYGTERSPSVRQAIAAWVEHPRFPMADGVPLEAVIARVEGLADFFRVQLGETDVARRASFYAGFAQCNACLDSLNGLKHQGAERIRPRQLQKLVAQATANGSDNPLWPAEVGAQFAATQPGAAIEPVARVIWWQLAMPQLPGSDSWSVSELRALRAGGTDIPETAARLDQVAQDWLRPVLAACEQLILVLPPSGEEVHPLWQMICSVTERPHVTTLETLLVSGSDAMVQVLPVPLPAARRWWQLPEDVAVALRKQESFSSLELMLFNPYHWLLGYPAKLRSSRIANLGGDFRMLGNLAHGLVERFFKHPDALRMPEGDFDNWFASAFAQIVDEEGALLRTPGRGADLENFRYRLHRSMQTLRDQIARAGIINVMPEQKVSGHFPGGELVGSADLVMKNARGEQSIVDMKWSGNKKFPEKFRKNSHLQLAIYAELLRQQTGAWPSVAYYILDRAELLAPDERTFPDAKTVPSESGENTAQLWQRILATWQWRVAQVRAGQFEVVMDGIPATDESAPPDHAIEMETLNAAYNDYRSLAGWEDRA